MPIEEIIKTAYEKDPNSGMPLDVVIGEFQQEVSQIIYYVTQAEMLPEDSLMQITRKNQIADLFTHYFVSHGFLPNSSLRASSASGSAAATQAALPDTDPEKENEGDRKKAQLLNYANVQKTTKKSLPSLSLAARHMIKKEAACVNASTTTRPLRTYVT